MKKNEIINAIIENLKKNDGTYNLLPIHKIVPIQSRMNARFSCIVANYLSVQIDKGMPTLYYYADNGSVCVWKCRNLRNEILNDILELAKEYNKPKVYVVVTDETYDYEGGIDIVMTTMNKEKAYKKFEELREEVSEWADDNGYEFEGTDTCVEAYEEGYAAQTHFYVTIYEKNLVNP